MDRQKKDAYYKYLCYVLSKSELALRSKSPLKARIVPEYLKPLNLGFFPMALFFSPSKQI